MWQRAGEADSLQPVVGGNCDQRERRNTIHPWKYISSFSWRRQYIQMWTEGMWIVLAMSFIRNERCSRWYLQPLFIFFYSRCETPSSFWPLPTWSSKWGCTWDSVLMLDVESFEQTITQRKSKISNKRWGRTPSQGRENTLITLLESIKEYPAQGLMNRTPGYGNSKWAIIYFWCFTC